MCVVKNKNSRTGGNLTFLWFCTCARNEVVTTKTNKKEEADTLRLQVLYYQIQNEMECTPQSNVAL